MALAGEGGVLAVVSVVVVELVLEMELEVADEVDVEVEAVLQDALFAVVAPGVDAVGKDSLVADGVADVAVEFLGVGSFHDEEAHEVEVVADGEVAVEGELEFVAHGEACAEVVAAHGVVVGCAASDGYGGEHEVVVEGVDAALMFGIESCSETGGFGDDGEVACCFGTDVAVVVDVFDVLVEADVEFPLMGQLPLDGADASADVEFADGGVVGVEVDEGIDVEVVVGAGGLAEVEVVVVGAVGEANVEVGDVLADVSAHLGMRVSDVVDVAVAQTYLEGVGFRLFFLAGTEAIDVEGFA